MKGSLTYTQKLSRRAAVMLAIFMLVVGGIVGSIPDIVAGDPSKLDFWIRSRVGAISAVIGLGVLVSYFAVTRRRIMVLAGRGTSYVVDSPAETWKPEEKQVYLTEAAREFADVIEVPGPTGLSNWRWPLGEGAGRWSDAVDDLVLSFRSVQANDDGATPNSVVCWAMFPVAVGFAARACSADRNLTLAIRQRPSRGRAGPIEVPDWKQPAHSFEPITLDSRLGTAHSPRAVRLTLTDPGGTMRGRASEAAPTPGSAENATACGSRVLVVRLHGGDWNGLRPGVSGPDEIQALNRSGTPIPVSDSAELYEWSCVSATGRHAWKDYPRLTSEIVEWIAQTADPVGFNFIGMLVPQEIQLGIGIQVARRQSYEWPSRLWPLLKPDNDHPLTVPGIDLGWESLTLVHLSGPR